MTHKWKRGDKAMVEIIGKLSDGSIIVRDNGRIDRKSLHPLPVPDALTAAEREFIEAWFAVDEGNAADQRWADAVKALRDLRTPPDPVEELKDAWQNISSKTPEFGLIRDQLGRMNRAIAAVEAAQGKK